MGEVINLRRVRRRLFRAEAAQDAKENRAKFGRSKLQTAAEAAEAERAGQTLDGAKLDQPPVDQTLVTNRANDRDTAS